MGDTRLTPSDVAFEELLGLTVAATVGATTREVVPAAAPAAVATIATVTIPVMTSAEISAPFPTRREVRAQYAAAASASPVKRATRRSKRPVSRRAASRSRVVVPVAAPVYALPSPVAPRKHPFRALVTIVAVGGLFATAALPAYALTSSGKVASADAAASIATQSLAVSTEAKTDVQARGTYTATTPGELAQQRSDFAKQANWDAYKVSGAQELGDDYPWFSELSNNQGGGLSPLNYFYRECVDFVAWRLNRDAGSTQAPFLYDWSVLTPNGGNASQWASNWQAHGWPTGTTPKVGAVAWFAGNHVAYVNTVNDDGTVLIEEYNYQSDHKYGQRTIAATDVALYLYAPPR